VATSVAASVAESPQAVKVKEREKTSIRAAIDLKKRILFYVVAVFRKRLDE
jgi:hypothetical protein